MREKSNCVEHHTIKRRAVSSAMALGLDQNFYVFVLPLVLLEIFIYGYAFTAEWRSCQVALGLLGLFWCFAALWVEIRLEQVYPGFNYAKPPEMSAYRLEERYKRI